MMRTNASASHNRSLARIGAGGGACGTSRTAVRRRPPLSRAATARPANYGVRGFRDRFDDDGAVSLSRRIANCGGAARATTRDSAGSGAGELTAGTGAGFDDRRREAP